MAVVFSAALIGTLARIAFFLVLAPKNLLVFSADTPYFEILKAFLLGFRFDVSAVCHLTLLFWLVSLLFSKKMSLSFWKFLLSLWAYLLIVDIGYFSFYNDRINVLIFGIFEDDTMALIKTFWKNYPVLWILLLTFLTSQFLSSRINKNFAGKGHAFLPFGPAA